MSNRDPYSDCSLVLLPRVPGGDLVGNEHGWLRSSAKHERHMLGHGTGAAVGESVPSVFTATSCNVLTA
jgi:hypothetical protein